MLFLLIALRGADSAMPKVKASPCMMIEWPMNSCLQGPCWHWHVYQGGSISGESNKSLRNVYIGTNTPTSHNWFCDLSLFKWENVDMCMNLSRCLAEPATGMTACMCNIWRCHKTIWLHVSPHRHVMTVSLKVVHHLTQLGTQLGLFIHYHGLGSTWPSLLIPGTGKALLHTKLGTAAIQCCTSRAIPFVPQQVCSWHW